MEIFVLYDTVGGFYETPFFGVNLRSVERGISDLPFLQKTHPVCVHPNDYVLYHLGSYENNSANFELFDSPQFINNLSAYIRPAGQGAAVGDAIPLKQQSAEMIDKVDAAE